MPTEDARRRGRYCPVTTELEIWTFVSTCGIFWKFAPQKLAASTEKAFDGGWIVDGAPPSPARQIVAVPLPATLRSIWSAYTISRVGPVARKRTFSAVP